MGSPTIHFHGAALTLTGDASATVGAAWEPQEVSLVREALRPGDKVLVAGGGFGWVAVQVALIVGVENVTVYEPQATLAQALRHNININGHALHVLNAALADSEGRAYLWQHPYWAASSLIRQGGHAGPIAVNTLTLTRAIETHRLTALVLDVEGAEHALLTTTDLTGLRAIVVEVHDAVIDGAGRNPLDIEQALTHGGFTLIQGGWRADGKAHYVAGVRA